MISRANGFAKQAGLVDKVRKTLTGPWREKKIVKAFGFRMRKQDPKATESILDGLEAVKNPGEYQTARGERLGRTLTLSGRKELAPA